MTSATAGIAKAGFCKAFKTDNPAVDYCWESEARFCKAFKGHNHVVDYCWNGKGMFFAKLSQHRVMRWVTAGAESMIKSFGDSRAVG